MGLGKNWGSDFNVDYNDVGSIDRGEKRTNASHSTQGARPNIVWNRPGVELRFLLKIIFP